MFDRLLEAAVELEARILAKLQRAIACPHSHVIATKTGGRIVFGCADCCEVLTK